MYLGKRERFNTTTNVPTFNASGRLIAVKQVRLGVYSTSCLDAADQAERDLGSKCNCIVSAWVDAKGYSLNQFA